MILIILIARIILWSLAKKTSEDARISNSENGSVTSSFSNIVIDGSTSEASLPLDNGSGRICGSIDFVSLSSDPIHPSGASNFKITIYIHC
jgi:hypothetical protein